MADNGFRGPPLPKLESDHDRMAQYVHGLVSELDKRSSERSAAIHKKLDDFKDAVGKDMGDVKTRVAVLEDRGNRKPNSENGVKETSGKEAVPQVKGLRILLSEVSVPFWILACLGLIAMEVAGIPVGEIIKDLINVKGAK